MSGSLYVSVVIDVFRRRVIGWSMPRHVGTELVLNALEMAIRQPKSKGVIHHSDQGSQYTSIAFGERCKRSGIRPSMGSAGDCYATLLQGLAVVFGPAMSCEGPVAIQVIRPPIEARLPQETRQEPVTTHQDDALR